MEKIVMIGAGSAMFTRGLVADLIRAGNESDLWLVDIDPSALEVAERLVRKMVQASSARVTVSASVDRKQALPGATVVICTVGVGGRRAWEKDVLIPRKYGIYAPVGDTVGPGGSARAMRMVPAMVAIAEDVLAFCPEALFFNYGNPMAVVCRAIRKATASMGREANVIGLCHGVVDTARMLARLLEVPFADLRYEAVGINHLTWFTGVRTYGQDCLPRLRAIAQERVHAAPPMNQPAGTAARWVAADSPFGNGVDPFSWQMLLTMGALPAPLDRHTTEFFPQFFRDGTYYGMRLGVDAFSFEGTIAVGDREYEQMTAHAYDPKPLDPGYFLHSGGEHEQVIDILLSIRGETGKVYSANLPNRGQVPNLPDEAIIESPAIADRRGLHPIQQPPLPPQLAGPLAQRYQWVEAVVNAALEQSREKFIQALILDGYVTSIAQAAALADELLAQ